MLVVETARGGVAGRNIFVRIATCSLCPTQARPVLSTAQLLPPNRTVLGQASCAGLHGRTVTGSRAWAWWRARARVGGPGWVRMHRGSSYATQMSPGSLVRRGGWGGGEKCVFMGCNVFPSPSHPIHSTAAAALSHGYWTSFFVIDP